MDNQSYTVIGTVNIEYVGGIWKSSIDDDFSGREGIVLFNNQSPQACRILFHNKEAFNITLIDIAGIQAVPLLWIGKKTSYTLKKAPPVTKPGGGTGTIPPNTGKKRK